MRVLVVIGTRPEAIKLAPVIKALRRRGATVRCCITSQHCELLHPLLEFFNIPRDDDLGVMRRGQGLADVTARVLSGVAGVLRDWPCDVVVVQGDTATALAAGLAAFYAGVQVAHVEAGLHTGDVKQPFPEEVNRACLDVFADYLFAPTIAARDNLLARGRPAQRIFVTGNTGVDALLQTRAALASREELPPLPVPLEPGEQLCLLTAHRRESFGRPLRQVFKGVVRLTEMQPRLRILAPLHPNPEVQAAAEVLHNHSRIHVTGPLDYVPFVSAMLAADLIITDSGGVQEEAATLGKPVLVTRELTERPEGIAAGLTTLVGTDPQRIVTGGLALLEAGKEQFRPCPVYGDGKAAMRIVDVLFRHIASAGVRRAA